MGIIGSPFEHLPLTAEGLSNKARAVRADVVGRLGDQAERLRKLRNNATAWRALGTTAIPDGVYAPIPEALQETTLKFDAALFKTPEEEWLDRCAEVQYPTGSDAV